VPYRDEDPLRGEAALDALARSLKPAHPGAAGSLLEGLSETRTVNRLGCH
jgi:putative transposase